MDTTYYNYLKLSAEFFVNDVIDFVESNNKNSVISLLFHNNFISEFKYDQYFRAFKKLLAYFYESSFKCITQSEIINLYKL